MLDRGRLYVRLCHSTSSCGRLSAPGPASTAHPGRADDATNPGIDEPGGTYEVSHVPHPHLPHPHLSRPHLPHLHLPHRARNRLARSRRTVVTAIRMLTGGTEARRWRDPEDPAYHTAERNRLIARLIPAGVSVLDLGAGQQELRRHLPRGCEYQACDLFEAPDVLRCDFNAGVYPAVEHRYDILVASGLLEFLKDPEGFLARLPEFGDMLLLSYRVRPEGEHLTTRLGSGYVSHYTQPELEELLTATGHPWRQVTTYEVKSTDPPHEQPIYRVDLDRTEA